MYMHKWHGSLKPGFIHETKTTFPFKNTILLVKKTCLAIQGVEFKSIYFAHEIKTY